VCLANREAKDQAKPTRYTGTGTWGSDQILDHCPPSLTTTSLFAWAHGRTGPGDH